MVVASKQSIYDLYDFLFQATVFHQCLQGHRVQGGSRINAYVFEKRLQYDGLRARGTSLLRPDRAASRMRMGPPPPKRAESSRPAPPSMRVLSSFYRAPRDSGGVTLPADAEGQLVFRAHLVYRDALFRGPLAQYGILPLLQKDTGTAPPRVGEFWTPSSLDPRHQSHSLGENSECSMFEIEAASKKWRPALDAL